MRRLCLSKIEREYLEDGEAFAKKHGDHYVAVVWSRIRKKVKPTFSDLLLIAKKDFLKKERKSARDQENKRIKDVMNGEDVDEREPLHL